MTIPIAEDITKGK